MAIMTDGTLLEPESKDIGEFHVGLGARLGAAASQAFEDSPLHQLAGIGEMENASGAMPDFGEIASGIPTGPQITDAEKPAVPRMDIIEANDRVRKAGLAPHLKLPDQPDIPPAQLTIMMDRARRRLELDTTVERGPQGFIPGALDVGTSFLVGAVDPINLASAFVPVMGELRYGKLLADAGASALGRAGVRAGVGAAQGASGQALLEPLDWYSHTQDGRDFGMSDVLHNILFGAALGGGLQAGGGAIADVYRGRKGRPLYPYGPGEPLEGTPQRVPVGLERGSETPAVPGTVAPERAPSFAEGPNADLERELQRLDQEKVHAERDRVVADERGALDYELYEGHLETIRQEQEEIYAELQNRYSAVPSPEVQTINDLPAQAHEDAMRGAISDLINGVPVRAGEMLEAASRSDPRIAESFEAHGRNAEIAERRADLAAGPAIHVGPKLARGRAAADPETWSLFEYLASRGGLRPDPELKAIFGSDRGPFVPGFGALIRKGGMPLDEALRSAKDGRYFFEAGDVTGAEARLTPRDLLDKIDDENRKRKVYRSDRRPDEPGIDRDQEAHAIVNARHDELEAASGQKGVHLDPEIERRVVEIIQKEGEHDVLAAHERAIMEDEERYNAVTEARHADPRDATVPGWDVPADAGATQAPGGAAARNGQAGGEPAGRGAGGDAGGQPRATGAGDRAPPETPLDRAAAWRALARTTPEFDAPEIVAASKAADAVPAPPSKLQDRVTASEKADAFAKQMYDMFAHRLPEEDRVRLDDLIKRIDDDHEAREIAIVRGGSCLFGVV